MKMEVYYDADFLGWGNGADLLCFSTPAEGLIFIQPHSGGPAWPADADAVKFHCPACSCVEAVVIRGGQFVACPECLEISPAK